MRFSLEPVPRRRGFHEFSAIERSQPCTEFLIEDGNLRDPRAVVFFEQAQSLANYLTG
jgi:hypothetical protein